MIANIRTKRSAYKSPSISSKMPLVYAVRRLRAVIRADLLYRNIP